MKTLSTVLLLSCTASLCLAASISEQLSSGGFTKMSSLLNDTGLNDTVKGKGPYTLFVPSNEAFKNASVPTDKNDLQTVLKNHIIAGNVTSKNITGEWKSLAGEPLLISKSENGTFTINNKTHITKADIFTDNGVIHQIDTVLIPSKNASSSAGNATASAGNATGNATAPATNATTPVSNSSSS